MKDKTFAILSGPSCVGKGPLLAALKRFHPDLECAHIPVMKSKESRPDGPRPDEGNVWDDPDFFRPEQDILKLDGDGRYAVGDCRGLPQAVDLKKVHDAEADLILVETYHTIGTRLVQNTFLKDVRILTIFVSPLARQEIDDLKRAKVALPDYLEQLMLHKQLVRARYHGKEVDADLIEDAIGRAGDAITELTSACQYSHVIVNHDGEGHANWHRLPSGVFTAMPEGDAGRAVNTLLLALNDSCPTGAENWSDLTL